MSYESQKRQEIMEAYLFLREKNQSIPSDSLELMKDAALERLVNKNESISPVSGNTLLSKARQMRLEQQLKIDSYTEHYTEYELGTLNGIDRIVKLIERHYR